MNDFTRRRALKTLFCSSAALALNLQARRAQAEIAKDGLQSLSEDERKILHRAAEAYDQP